MSNDPVVIVAAKRTPIGAFQGALSDVSATELGAAAVAAAVAESGVEPGDVGRVLMGCVLPAGLGQAPARQAALGAGLPMGVPCATVNKMCGSGMEALVLGHDLIAAGSAGIGVLRQVMVLFPMFFYCPPAGKGTVYLDGMLVGVALLIGRLMDVLEDNDDVQDVYSNFDISEETLERIDSA